MLLGAQTPVKQNRVNEGATLISSPCASVDPQTPKRQLTFNFLSQYLNITQPMGDESRYF